MTSTRKQSRWAKTMERWVTQIDDVTTNDQLARDVSETEHPAEHKRLAARRSG